MQRLPSKKEFYSKTLDNQPTNIASVGAGIVAGHLARVAITSIAAAGTGIAATGAAPLIAIILVGWGAGLAVQWAMGYTGADKAIGNKLKEMLIDND
ncbi:hypothetical protein [Pseudomonas syringae]|uniref:hypothetical protein n=1 Tax=Pseudomonas syringae TaxID=317 RepID=UPI0015D50AE5|nr:hypothetical protein [Pseudomonas syringae]